jgi:MoaA/NifB/PqqE/SkfB family radical SAM enzyme
MSEKLRMNHLTIKPVLACTANCPGCASRRLLHRSLRGGPNLSFEDWVNVLHDGRSLGAEHLTISGGEPTLYDKLPDLVKVGYRLGYVVVLNTNGSRIDKAYATGLAESGLHGVRISIYSHRAEVHDTIRRSKGLFVKACGTVKAFKEVQKRLGRPRVWTQAVILRENVRYLDELLKFHHELGSEAILLSYLEGDFDQKLLMSENDIIAFREATLPKMLSYCSTLDDAVRKTACERIGRLYDLGHASAHDFSRGLYRVDGTCAHLGEFAMVLANGDVHPCPIVEYTHEPLMGNLFQESLPAIWRADRWNELRNSLHDKCCFCPINLHTTIPLAQVEAKKSLVDQVRGLPNRFLSRGRQQH